MMAEENKNIIKSTNEGKLYVRTSDLFKQSEVKSAIKALLKSSIVVKIKDRQEKAAGSARDRVVNI